MGPSVTCLAVGDEECPRSEVHLLQPQAKRLAKPQARAEKDQEESTEREGPQVMIRQGVGFAQQAADLGHREDVREELCS